MSKQIKVVCPTHGLFEQVAESHLKYGCRQCSFKIRGQSRSKTLQGELDKRSRKFFNKAKEVHGATYDYTLTIFKDVREKVTITCHKHGPFVQIARVHIGGSGCQLCAKESSTSKPERAWLDSLGVDVSIRNKIVRVGGKRLSVDAFDPSTNTVYEFWGDYWHGNPLCPKASKSPKAEERYRKTLAKINLIKANGYNLVEIWEKDWKVTRSQ